MAVETIKWCDTMLGDGSRCPREATVLNIDNRNFCKEHYRVLCQIKKREPKSAKHRFVMTIIVESQYSDQTTVECIVADRLRTGTSDIDPGDMRWFVGVPQPVLGVHEFGFRVKS